MFSPDLYLGSLGRGRQSQRFEGKSRSERLHGEACRLRLSVVAFAAWMLGLAAVGASVNALAETEFGASRSLNDVGAELGEAGSARL